MLPEHVTSLPIKLRPFALEDAPRVQLLAGDFAVAETTALIPHPYPNGMAEEWIATHQAQRDRGIAFVYGITQAEDGLLVGAIEVRPVADEHENFGYWIVAPYWGRGFATAAARAMVALTFGYLDCDQMTASHLLRNPASGRVMEKCGLTPVQRVTRAHRGKQEPFCIRGITRDAWERWSASGDR
ncbi:MAG: GNAT family N-acetyltransferase [Betaproteobacteria bacterium]|nr:MAG: GNAT family N-acetyltransferase [Betaproteobacteria bacterium]